MKININLILLITLFSMHLSIYADQPRFKSVFKSENQRYILSLIPSESDSEEWVMIDDKSKSIMFRINKNLSDKSVIISDYGIHIVVIDDFSEQYWRNNPTVLSFYFKDSLLSNYKLNQLVNKINNISVSVSHFGWFPESYKLIIDNDKFSLMTYELIHYNFDIVTGKIINKLTDSVLLEDDIYVYGKVNKIGKREYEIFVVTPIRANLKYGDIIKYKSNYDDERLNGFYYSVIIRDNYVVRYFDYTVNMGGFKE